MTSTHTGDPVCCAAALASIDVAAGSTIFGEPSPDYFQCIDLGAGGQLVLFEALRTGPAYLVFPTVSLYPVVTVLLSLWLLKERAARRAWTGIALSLPAMVLLSWQPPSSAAGPTALWLPLAMLVFAAWGVKAYGPTSPPPYRCSTPSARFAWFTRCASAKPSSSSR